MMLRLFSSKWPGPWLGVGWLLFWLCAGCDLVFSFEPRVSADDASLSKSDQHLAGDARGSEAAPDDAGLVVQDSAALPDLVPWGDVGPGVSPGWAQSYGSPSADEIPAVATDNQGNLYLAGPFQDTITLAGTSHTSAGGNDILVASFAPDGALRWSQRYGGPYNDSADVLLVDDNDNLFIAGTAAADTDFGGGAVSSNGVYVASFTAAGTYRWHVASTGGNTTASGGCITAQGHLVFTGSFWTSSFSFGGPALSNQGYNDIWLVSLTEAGAHRWTRGFGTSNQETGHAVGCDGAGNLVLGARSLGTLNLGGGALPNQGVNDIYLGRFDSSGSHLWSAGFGSAVNESLHDLVADPQGNLYLAAQTLGSVDFGGGPIGPGEVLVSLSPSGAHRWSMALVSDVTPGVLAVDPAGNLLLAGGFYNTVDMGGGPLTSAGASDVLLARFSPAGSHLWSARYGGSSYESGVAIAVDPAFRVTLTGSFSGATDLGGTQLTSAGNSDAFVFHLVP